MGVLNFFVTLGLVIAAVSGDINIFIVCFGIRHLFMLNNVGAAITEVDSKASETVCYGDLGCFTTASPVK